MATLYHTPTEKPVTGKRTLQNELPDSNGDNKYTKNMVPGYTGYVPRWPFKFGDTYKGECDICLDEFITNMRTTRQKTDDILQATLLHRTLVAMKTDPEVRDHLNSYRDNDPEQLQFRKGYQRGSLDPHIPGYQGFVPRIHTTEIGVGCGYQEMTKKGLEDFSKIRRFMKPRSE